MKKIVGIAILVAVVVSIATVGRAKLREFRKPGPGIPTALVTRGDVSIKVETTGALTAGHSALLISPPISGDTERIVRLLNTGTAVKAGDVVVAFDPTEEEYDLDQARSQLAQADQEIIKAKADAAVQAAEDKAQLVSDQFDVRRAALVVSTNSLVSAIDAQKNILTLNQAKRSLAQLISDVKSHTASGEATLAVSEQKRQKALLAIQRAQRNIDNMTVRSPMNGLVEVKQNQMAYGGIMIAGMPLPEFHVGDSTYAGMPIAEVIDPAEMDIDSRVSQSDRANIRTGEPAQIAIDALPGRMFQGRIKTISSVASRGGFFFQAGAVPTFGVTIQLTASDPSLRPGFQAHIVILGNTLHNVLYVPPQAIFQENGSPVVYVKAGSRFHSQPVRVRYRTETRTVVEGVAPGAAVALVNPEVSAGTVRSAPALPGAASAGGMK